MRLSPFDLVKGVTLLIRYAPVRSGAMRIVFDYAIAAIAGATVSPRGGSAPIVKAMSCAAAAASAISSGTEKFVRNGCANGKSSAARRLTTKSASCLQRASRGNDAAGDQMPHRAVEQRLRRQAYRVEGRAVREFRGAGALDDETARRVDFQIDLAASRLDGGSSRP